MQTFLPYPSFKESAQVLDWRRLGKQRVECLQILNSLVNGGGWRNHPAVKMWEGYEGALQQYGVEICQEWIRRGYKDTTLDKIQAFHFYSSQCQNPEWLGNLTFHASHRSNLLRKNPEHYSQFGWLEDSELPYVWPTKTQSGTNQ